MTKKGNLLLSCPECDRLRLALVEANFDYVNATAQLMDVANRPPDPEVDPLDYRAATARLESARDRIDGLQQEFARHRVAAHRAQVWAAGR